MGEPASVPCDEEAATAVSVSGLESCTAAAAPVSGMPGSTVDISDSAAWFPVAAAAVTMLLIDMASFLLLPSFRLVSVTVLTAAVFWMAMPSSEPTAMVSAKVVVSGTRPPSAAGKNGCSRAECVASGVAIAIAAGAAVLEDMPAELEFSCLAAAELMNVGAARFASRPTRSPSIEG
jgi:hypothetical protein